MARKPPDRDPLAAGVLWLMPADFRAEHGEELREAIARRRSRARLQGRWTALLAAVRIVADALAVALRLRWRRWRWRPGGSPGGRSVPEKRRSRALELHHRPAPRGWRDRMDKLALDVKHALRNLASAPTFAVLIVLTLALGIGANALIYSLIDAVVLNPFDFPEPDRVIGVGAEFPRAGSELDFVEALGAPEIAAIRDQSETLEAVVGFDLGNRQIAGGDVAENLGAGFWWGDALEVIGISPLVGRGFDAEDYEERRAVALIGERVWRGRFGADPAVVGSTIHVEGVAYEVIGVFPHEADIYGTELWLPMWAPPETLPRSRRQFNIIARARPGASLQEINAELATIARRVEQEHVAEFPEYEGWRLAAMTWPQVQSRQLRAAAVLLMASVGFVLLLVCANVASLLLAKAADRRREMALRAALGAGRHRMVRQLLTESGLLALVGGAAGVGLAYAGLELLMAYFPAELVPIRIEPEINGRVLAFSAGVAALTGLLFGLVPALQGSRFDPQRTLALESHASTGSRSRRRWMGAFVAVEVALALVLLVGAGLLVHSLIRIQDVDPGFDPTDVLTLRLTLPRNEYQGPAIAGFFFRLAEEVEAIPGVESAAAVSQYPSIVFFGTRFALEDRAGQAIADEGELPRALLTLASEDYFDTLGVPLMTGRAFTEHDLPESPRVALVNEAFADRYLGDGAPVGKRFRLGDDPERPWIEVVGVVADVRNRGLQDPPAPEIFLSIRQVPDWWNQLFLLIRTAGDPRSVLPQVRDVVAGMDPDQPIYAIYTLEEAIASGFAVERFAMQLLIAFALVALVLAAVGIYGVVSHAVAQRTREIGVRMALGAHRGQVRGMVVRQALLPVAIGAAVGFALSIGLGRAMQGMLYEVSGADPATIGSVAVLLTAVAAVASYLPARRASGIDPVRALRSD